MSIHAYLTLLKEKNIVISVQNNEVKIIAAKELLTDEIVQEIRRRKPEILDYFKNSSHMAISTVPDKPYYILSHAQKRLWVMDQIAEVKGLYNVPMICSFSSLDIPSFNKAFTELLSRHEILRTIFPMVDGEPRQCVLHAGDFDTSIECRRIEKDDSVDWEAHVNEELFQPLDLRKSAWRAILYERPDGSYFFILILHHIVIDNWSIKILERDFASLYNHKTTGAPLQLPVLPIQYKDFAHWQQERLRLGYFEASSNYWKDKLGGELPILQLPLDSKRSDFKTHEGASVEFELSPETIDGLILLSQSHQVSFYMVVVAIVKSFLYRYSNLQKDIIVGSIATERSHSDLENQVGFYVNTVVFRSSIEDVDSFSTYLIKVRDVILEAYAHMDFPFDLLIEELNLKRDMSRNPLFDVMISFEDEQAKGNNVKAFSEMLKFRDEGVNKFDLTFSFTKSGNRVGVDINYNRGLFRKERIVKMVGHLKNLIAGILQSPTVEIHKLSLLSKAETDQINQVFNDTLVRYDLDVSIKELMERQAKISPDAVCVLSQEGVMSFKDFNEKANQLAHYLIDKHHIRRGDYVGIMMSSSVERVIALASLVKIGSAYVPIDPDYPQIRKHHIIGDTRISVLLVDSSDKNVAVIKEIENLTIVPICISEFGTYPVENIKQVTSAADIFTILYTSGSTGLPKGVLLPQKGIINRMQWLWNKYKFSQADVIYQKTPFVFDVSMGELFMPLCFGAQLLLASSDSTEQILFNLIRYKVTYVHFSPTMLGKFLDNAGDKADQIVSVRYVFASGEALLKETVKRFYSRFQIPLINLYGPTEASIEASVYETKPGDNVILIGKPIANVKLYIMDRLGGMLPCRVPGEIGIGGVGVAKEYLHHPEKTAEKFIPDRFCSEENQKIYKTGDIGSWTEYGEIEFLGRQDNQTNINGSRIEPGEIESAMLEHNQVKEAVVMVEKDDFNNYRLIAYYVRKNLATVQPKEFVDSYPEEITNDEPHSNLPFLGMERTFHGDSRVDELIDCSATEHADKIAVIFDDISLSYKYLNESASRMAQCLRTDWEIKPEDRIGIVMQRSERAIITMLAILRTGAAYVPIDADYPTARIQYILNDASVRFVISDISDLKISQGIAQVQSYQEITERSVSYPSSQTTLNKVNNLNLCYVCYTSGSTGLPKGVMVEHHSVVDYIKTFISYFQVSAEDSIIQQASLSFDTSVEEIFPILCSGGMLIIHRGGGRDIDNLIKIINIRRPTLISTTPLVINELNSRFNGMRSIPRLLISGGDELRASYIDKLFGNIKLYNTYGPTETTVCASFYQIENIKKSHVIGRPIAGHRIYLLDDALKEVEEGCIGEICIAGPGLARGYVNQVQETHMKFVINPFEEELLYRTGDLGKWNSDAFLEFCGRKDRQIKIRGYRIEPIEIDELLAGFSRGINGFTTVKNDSENNRHLITYYTTKESIKPSLLRSFLADQLPHYMVPDYLQELDEFPTTFSGKIDISALPLPAAMTADHSFDLEVKSFLRARLPSYMVPVHFRNIEKMPMTITGKIDRKALEKLAALYQQNTKFVAPCTTTEKKISAIWESVLNQPNLGLMHNFFEIGGNSLKATQMLSALYRAFKREFSLKDIFNNPTISDLAKVVENSGGSDKSLLIQLSAVKRNHSNIFFIPPILGSSTIYRSLANEIAEDFNVYGVQYQGFDTNEKFHSSIEEMADNFVREIKNIDKGNIVNLVGYSMGVPVVFEMGKILEAQGTSVQLVLIDRIAFDTSLENSLIPFNDQLVEEVLETELKYWLQYLEDRDLERIKRLVVNNIHLLNSYVLRGRISSKIVAVEATNGWQENRMESWKKFTSGDFSHYYIESGHYELLNESNLPMLARLISNAFSPLLVSG